MAYFKPAKSLQAFGKIGLYGPNKSGKTYTASSIAVGLHKMIKSEKAIGFIDTELGLSFVKPQFDKAEIELVYINSRAFKDLIPAIQEAAKSVDILIIDSISAFWNDLMESYQKRTKKKRLSFPDWNILKPMWRGFSDLYVTSPIHIIMCGRLQFEWDFHEAEDGQMELHKTGTRMKAETELGYEPSLLVEMERVKEEKTILHRAWIVGDRSTRLDGKYFDNPKFKDFKPHFDFLEIGGEHAPLDTESDSVDMFEIDGKPEWKQNQIKKKIALEKIQASAQALWPSNNKDDKEKRQEFMETLFETRSWTEISEQISLETLEEKVNFLPEFESLYRENKEASLKSIWEDALKINVFKSEPGKEDDIPF